MKKKRNKRKTLIRIRQALIVVAAVLFCVSVFSGYMTFFGGKPAPEAPAIPQTVPPTLSTEPVEALEETAEDSFESSEGTAAVAGPSGEAEADGPIGDLNDLTNVTTIEEKETTQPPPPIGNGSGGPIKLPGSLTGGGTVFTPCSDRPISEIVTFSSTSIDEALEIPGVATEETTETTSQPTMTETTVPATEEATVPTAEETTQPAAPTEQPTLPAPLPSPPQPDLDVFPWHVVFFSSLGLLALDLLAVLLLDRKILSMRKASHPLPVELTPRTILNEPIFGEPTPSTPTLTVGTLHKPGRRQYQQDSLGHSIVLDGTGILAVLADGMGGLQDGDKVSQQIVLRSMELGAKLKTNEANGALYRILNQVNEDVNRMLTPSGLYKCGSTVVAVLVQDKRFQWISVGDSRIYLYREGYVNRLNRDHDLFQEWMPEILEGKRLSEDCLADPNGRKLTSFIGMGKLKYVDGSIHATQILPGDRIILMSDGVYGEVPEEQMAAIFKENPDVNKAAAALDRRIRANQNPHQDNYSALILGF